MTITSLSRKTKVLWIVNYTVVALVIAAGVLVDGNGRLPGLEETASTILAVLLFSVGMTINGLLLWVNSGRWLQILVIFALYLIMILPALGLF